MTPKTLDNNNNVIQSGSVIIQGVEHLVQARFVKCDSSLNSKPWDTTEKKERCLKCFDKPIKKRSMFGAQLELF